MGEEARIAVADDHHCHCCSSRHGGGSCLEDVGGEDGTCSPSWKAVLGVPPVKIGPCTVDKVQRRSDLSWHCRNEETWVANMEASEGHRCNRSAPQ